MNKKTIIDKNLRLNLMKYLAENNITQTEVGKICGKTRTTVHSWVSGNSTPSANDIKAICQHYKISADYLLGIGE